MWYRNARSELFLSLAFFSSFQSLRVSSSIWLWAAVAAALWHPKSAAGIPTTRTYTSEARPHGPHCLKVRVFWSWFDESWALYPKISENLCGRLRNAVNSNWLGVRKDDASSYKVSSVSRESSIGSSLIARGSIVVAVTSYGYIVAPWSLIGVIARVKWYFCPTSRLSPKWNDAFALLQDTTSALWSSFDLLRVWTLLHIDLSLGLSLGWSNAFALPRDCL